MVNAAFNVLAVLISLLVLIRIADLVLSISLLLGRRARLNQFLIGTFILALCTSLPELFIATVSSLGGFVPYPDVPNSYMNFYDPAILLVFGSNFANMTIIIGLSSFLYLIQSKGRNTVLFGEKKHSFLALFVILACTLVTVITKSPLLIIFYVFFAVFSFLTKGDTSSNHNTAPLFLESKSTTLLVVFLSILTLILYVLSAIVTLSIDRMLIHFRVGAYVLYTAFLTSIPELIVTLQCFRKKLFDAGLGNVLGSCIINISLVLPIAFLLQKIFNPVPFNATVLYQGLPLSGTELIHPIVFFNIIIVVIALILVQKKTIKIFDAGLLISLYILVHLLFYLFPT